MDKIELPLLKSNAEQDKVPFAVFSGLAILFVLLIISIFSVTFKRTYKMNYTEYSDVDYNVYLKENEFYDVEYLPKDKQYLTELISYIDTDLSYEFVAAANIDLDYEYYVTGKLMIDNSNGKNILTKEYELIPNKSVSLDDSREFSIKENLIVQYNEYNDIAKEFVKKYGINAYSSFVIELYVDVSGKHSDFENKLNNTAVITITIPLADDTTNIELDYDTVNNADAVLQYSSVLITNKILFIACCAFAILDVITISVIIFILIRNRTAETKYNLKLKKIKADFGKFLSETVITERVEDMLKTKSLRIEVIKTFEDLLDLRDNLGKQILYHEERAGEECVFYIITENIGYIYVMDLNEFKKKN